MGTINSALLAILSDPAKGVYTLVGNRINAHNAPTRYANPKIVFVNVTGRPINHIKGSSGYDHSVLQIECWGDTLPQAEAVANAVRNLIDGYPTDGSEHTFDNVAISSIVRISNTDDFTIPTDGTQQGKFRIARDYRISHRVSVPDFT
jgi:hypothetical protein